MKWEYEISSKDKNSIKEHIESDEFIIELNENMPYLVDEDKKQLEGSIDPFSDLDKLDRCGTAFTCIIGEKLNNVDNHKFKSRIKPTAWKSIGCDDIVDGKCLYNRCHLIGRQLATTKADKRGLITGTRKFNVNGMFEYEEKVSNYIRENPKHHILYRVTPYFEKNNLLAYGVQMEILDIDDKKSLFHNVFVYNKQPGFTIDYRNGDVYSDNSLSLSGRRSGYNIYVIDKNTKRFHKKGQCMGIGDSKMYFVGKDQVLIEKGYHGCDICST